MVSYIDIKNYILQHQDATLQEICTFFNKMDNEFDICTERGECIATGIDGEFWNSTLQPFIRDNYYVKVKSDPLACLISDRIRYTGRKKYLCIVLRIEE